MEPVRPADCGKRPTDGLRLRNAAYGLTSDWPDTDAAGHGPALLYFYGSAGVSEFLGDGGGLILAYAFFHRLGRAVNKVLSFL